MQIISDKKQREKFTSEIHFKNFGKGSYNQLHGYTVHRFHIFCHQEYCTYLLEMACFCSFTFLSTFLVGLQFFVLQMNCTVSVFLLLCSVCQVVITKP